MRRERRRKTLPTTKGIAAVKSDDRSIPMTNTT